MNSRFGTIRATTLGDLLLRAAQRWPSQTALTFPDWQASYDSFAQSAALTAKALIGAGIRPGDHIGILSPNLPGVAETIFGITLAGAVAVPLNARYKSVELSYVIRNADLRLLFTTTRVAELVDYHQILSQALPGLMACKEGESIYLSSAPLLRDIVLLEDASLPGARTSSLFSEQAAKVSEDEFLHRRASVALSDPCIMMFTSGTTSSPKGCRLSHESVVRNAAEMNRRLGIRNDEVMWNPLPMFHMAAIIPLLSIMWSGGCFASETHFDASESLEYFDRLQPTFLYPAFPNIMSGIINHAGFSPERWPRIRLVNNVAPEAQLRSNMRKLPKAKHVSAYGMTEASGICCHTDPDDSESMRASTCGTPYSGVQMKVVSVEDGIDVPIGEQGEMLVKGFSLFQGYYNAPEKNAESIDDEGWFHTGDLCSMDAEGRVSFHGRLKDMLKIGGENVAALEIESFLATHPAVELAQVVGISDPDLQEVAAAFVQLKLDVTCTEEELIEYCKGRIASFKIPRYVQFVNEWPMSATKIQKNRLLDMLS